MATRARTGADLAVTINANTSAPSNTIVVSSSGNVTTANDLSIAGHLVGHVSNTYLQANFVQNTATIGDTRLDLANAQVTFVTKSTALASNTALVNLISDRLQVANAETSFVTKAVHLTTNTALVNLIADREQVGNVDTTLVDYWPSANIIAYVGIGNTIPMQTNTSIFIATGGETEVAIPYTNTSHIQVKLNGVRLTPDEDYVTANNTHIGGLLALSAADVLTVTEYRQHTSNVLNRSSSGSGAYVFGGTTSGYAAGGMPGSNVIDKWPFASSGNATDVGDLSVARDGLSGQSSKTNGYASGGRQVPGHNVIDKWPFSSDTNASDIADLTVGRGGPAGHSSSESGYASGGQVPTDPPNTICNTIDKFPFSSDSNATDVGDLTMGRCLVAGSSSSTHGYAAGGRCPAPGVPSIVTDRIDKFPFSSDSNASDVGNLIAAKQSVAGQSSSTHGYVTGGSGTNLPVDMCRIEKYSFSSDGDATSVGNLAQNAYHAAGSSSTTDGYQVGGRNPATPPYQNFIQKFPFASDTNASDIGDLTTKRSGLSGQQV